MLTSLHTAVIREGIRLASVVTTRLPRLAPDEVLQYKEWDIPAGVSSTVRLVSEDLNPGPNYIQTSVSMSTYFILRDPGIFPEPTKFLPERWLVEPEELQQLERYLVPGSKGTLGCPGQR